jgi:hypothetical protein
MKERSDKARSEAIFSLKEATKWGKTANDMAIEHNLDPSLQKETQELLKHIEELKKRCFK